MAFTENYYDWAWSIYDEEDTRNSMSYAYLFQARTNPLAENIARWTWQIELRRRDDEHKKYALLEGKGDLAWWLRTIDCPYRYFPSRSLYYKRGLAISIGKLDLDDNPLNDHLVEWTEYPPYSFIPEYLHAFQRPSCFLFYIHGEFSV